MTLLYVYCGLCWLLMSHSLWYVFRWLRAAGRLKEKRSWLSLALALLAFILAPLMMPFYMVLGVVTRRDREVARQLRSYREYSFDPVKLDELSGNVVAFLEEHTGPLECLRCRHWPRSWSRARSPCTTSVPPPRA